MSAEEKLIVEMESCYLCEMCDELLKSSCPVFPSMHKLVDEELKLNKKIDAKQLKEKIFNLCSFCGMCPCDDLKWAIINAKTEYVEKNGQSFQNKTIGNVEKLFKLGCMSPSLTNFMIRNHTIRSIIENVVGIDKNLKLPQIHKVDFREWIINREKNIPKKTRKTPRKVAYYLGCSTRYFYPEVGMAAVEVFWRNGVDVLYPDQKCCGMPTLVEGDRKSTVEYTKFNVDSLAKAVNDGSEIVVSCPTCAVLFKEIIKNDYFNFLDSEKAKSVSEHTYDVGEYLENLYRQGELDTDFGPIPSKAAHFRSCKTKAQNIGMFGTPFSRLMTLIPQLSVVPVVGNYCCGLAGTFGFKHKSYDLSMKIGDELIREIKATVPDIIAADCNGCRIQFEQKTDLKVAHPIQIIKESYEKYNAKSA